MTDNFKDLILSDGSQPLEKNKNDYFLVTITDLLPGKTYPVEFRWNYKDSTKKGDWGAVLNIVTPGYTVPVAVDVTPYWTGSTFNVDFKFNPTLAANSNISHFEARLIVGSNPPKIYSRAFRRQLNQTFTLTPEENKYDFGFFQNSFSGSIVLVDKDNNRSAEVSFPLTTRSGRMPAPVIAATGTNTGYSITYTDPSPVTYPEYDRIVIEESVSDSNTDPGTGYSTVFSGKTNPAAVPAPAPTGAKRWVRARFFDNGDLPSSSYSNSVSVTPVVAAEVNTTAPSAPASGSLTGGIDPNGTIGFNGYIDISWTAVNDSTLRGYRIRFRRNGSSDPYSYVDSPGTGTSYRLAGLAIGTTYEVGIASYNIINNVSNVNGTLTWTSLGTYTPAGTPFIGTNVTTTGYFEAFPGGGNTSNAFRFGYAVEPGKRGLTFNSNNYWYIDSSASALFKLGGDTNNYISWDGSNFIVQGDIRAQKGTFTGNVGIVGSGASIFAGSLPDSGARLVMKSDGITAYNNGGTPTTNIYASPTTVDGNNISFKTDAANIGGWSINSSQIYKTIGGSTLSLDSSTNSITASGTTATYTVGMRIPTSNDPSSIVLYAGSNNPSSAPFRVAANGAVTMTSATITGYVGAADVANNIGGVGVTTITGDKVRTGSIEGNNYSYISGNFSSQGTQIDLTNNRIRSPKFAVDGGSAYFAGDINIVGSSTTTSISSSTGIISINDASSGGLYGGGINISNASRSSTLGGGGLSWSVGSSYTGAVYMDSSGIVNLKASSAQSVSITADDGLNRSAYPIYMNGHVAVLNALYIGDSTSDETSTADGSHMSTGRLTLRRFGNTPLFLHRTESGTGPLRVATFHIGGVAAGGINAFTGQAATFVNPSDYRMKENIQDYNNASEVIKRSRLRKFNFKNSPEEEVVGFIAHEYAEVNPKFVIGEKDAIDEEGNPIYQEMMMGAITPYLIGALKESILKIEQLEQRLDALEG